MHNYEKHIDRNRCNTIEVSYWLAFLQVIRLEYILCPECESRMFHIGNPHEEMYKCLLCGWITLPV